MADLLRFTVPCKPEYVGVVRMAISSAANTAGFDIEDIEDIKVAVSEVCHQIFCTGRQVMSYNFSCELGEEGIYISIDDTGNDYDIEVMESCGCFPCRSMVTDMFDPMTSFHMLKVLMDEVDVFSDRNEGMLIKMFKHL